MCVCVCELMRTTGGDVSFSLFMLCVCVCLCAGCGGADVLAARVKDTKSQLQIRALKTRVREMVKRWRHSTALALTNMRSLEEELQVLLALPTCRCMYVCVCFCCWCNVFFGCVCGVCTHQAVLLRNNELEELLLSSGVDVKAAAVADDSLSADEHLVELRLAVKEGTRSDRVR